MIPQTFEEWRYCIVHDCGIKLTKEFAAQRLEVYTDTNNTETKKFISLYGDQHLQNIVQWLKQV